MQCEACWELAGRESRLGANGEGLRVGVCGFAELCQVAWLCCGLVNCSSVTGSLFAPFPLLPTKLGGTKARLLAAKYGAVL